MTKLHPFLRTLVLALVAHTLSLQAAELRTWTSADGKTIEAKLQKMDDKVVQLVTADSKTLRIQISKLSLADRVHLVENADADQAIITDIKLTVPEKDFRLDRDTMEKLDEKMGFANRTDLEFRLFQSEHFLIATTGRFRAKALAETAERLWHGMAFQHVGFRKDWGDKRKVIIVSLDDEIYESLGDWYAQWLKDNTPDPKAAADESKRIKKVWMKVSASSIRLPEAQQKKFNAFEEAKIFRIRDKRNRSYKKVFGPFPTHAIAGMLLSQQMGGISDTSPQGYFAITKGHAYFKEIQLGGRSETQLLDATGTDKNELTNSSGWQDGRSWAKSLRKMVRKGDIKPDLIELLSYEVMNLTPERLVLMYSFSYYLQTDPARQANFAKLIEQIQSNKQIPAPVEIAKIFGFETIEAFENDWTEFIKSTDFK